MPYRILYTNPNSIHSVLSRVLLYTIKSRIILSPQYCIQIVLQYAYFISMHPIGGWAGVGTWAGAGQMCGHGLGWPWYQNDKQKDHIVITAVGQLLPLLHIYYRLQCTRVQRHHSCPVLVTQLSDICPFCACAKRAKLVFCSTQHNCTCSGMDTLTCCNDVLNILCCACLPICPSLPCLALPWPTQLTWASVLGSLCTPGTTWSDHYESR